jgi:DNA topoisomerase VI subunit A
MINISTKKAILILFAVLFCLSLAFNGWLIYQVSLIAHAYEAQQTNTRTLDFTKMFVEDVLMADKEIDFDTRLTLETAVRGLNDQQIFDQWQKFTKSTTKEDASNQAKILLDSLVKKIAK